MRLKLSAEADMLLARLRVDCVNVKRMTPKLRGAVDELNAAGFFVQTENPLHEGYWITYDPKVKLRK